MFCRQCAKEVLPNAVVCVGCGVAPNDGSSFCAACGQPSAAGAAVCVKCGAAFAPPKPAVGDKSKVVAGLLALFLGQFGVHYFYLGKNPLGFLCLGLLVAAIPLMFLCGVGVFVLIGLKVWNIVDCIRIFTGAVRDGQGLALRD